ncbi:menaquinone-specific isochorismate synthase [Pasteurella multocida]|nr:menaquinone-specific isochorismate synthase [Pasteurella multocida]
MSVALKTAAPLAATDLLAESEKYNLGCYHFMLAESEQRAFIGSSPELLYRRHGFTIKNGSLSGHRVYGGR